MEEILIDIKSQLQTMTAAIESINDKLCYSVWRNDENTDKAAGTDEIAALKEDLKLYKSINESQTWTIYYLQQEVNSAKKKASDAIDKLCTLCKATDCDTCEYKRDAN